MTHCFLALLMLFSTESDPCPASPVLGLAVDGEPLPAERLALTVMPGDSVTLSPSGDRDLHWYANAGTPATGDGATFGWRAPRDHGIYRLDVQHEEGVESYTLIVPVDASRFRTVSLNSFHVGSYGDGCSRDALPDAFIEVTAETFSAPVSTHMTVGDYLCHIEGRWPQYMVLDLRLTDKLERILAAVREVYPPASSIANISGFRTPAYNAEIGNNTTESLHLYGMAADVWIESWPPNGLMDDVDRNKRVDVYDGEYIVELTRVLEASGEVVTGGASAYRWNAYHGPFVHVDTRGSMASWPTSRSLVADPVI